MLKTPLCFQMSQKVGVLKSYLNQAQFLEDIPYVASRENAYFGNAYMLTQDKNSSYWEKLDDAYSELSHITEDYISKITPLSFSQV